MECQVLIAASPELMARIQVAGSTGPGHTTGATALASSRQATSSLVMSSLAGSSVPAHTGGQPSVSPLRIAAIPRYVLTSALTVHTAQGVMTPAGAATSHLIPVGIGGDHAHTMSMNVAEGALVVGPRGTGRSSSLRTMCDMLLGRHNRLPGRHAHDTASSADLPHTSEARRLAIVARDPQLIDAAQAYSAMLFAPTASGLRQLVDWLSQQLDLLPGQGVAPAPGFSAQAQFSRPAASNAQARATSPGRLTPLVMIDDADLLSMLCPGEMEVLAQMAGDSRITAMASATTAHTSMSHHGLLAQLRGNRTGLILHPAERGSDEVFSVSVADALEHGSPIPGRGALVNNGKVTVVQVAFTPMAAANSASSPTQLLLTDA